MFFFLSLSCLKLFLLDHRILIFRQIFFSSFFFVCRYYRANSVRYPTSPCEGGCALNHYCAITRVDYHEFRHCLESAAGALASAGTRPNVCIPIAVYIALLLATYTIMKCQQRKLLFEWLQFLIVDLVIGVLLLLVKCSRKLIVTVFDAFASPQWRNNCVALFPLKLLATLKMTDLGNRNNDNDNNNSNNDDDDDDDDDRVSAIDTAVSATTTMAIHATAADPIRDNIFEYSRTLIDHTKVAMFQLFHVCVKLSNNSNFCHTFRLHEHVSEHNEKKLPMPMPQITADTTTNFMSTTTNHQNYFYEASRFNSKSCQNKLLTTVDSLNQTHRPMNSSTRYNV